LIGVDVFSEPPPCEIAHHWSLVAFYPFFHILSEDKGEMAVVN